MERIEKILKFLNLMEELKTVERANMVLGGKRKENSAEHSWHAAMIGMFLGPELDPEADIDKVIRMLLIHDVVEIKAGDTFFYSEEREGQREREERALGEIADLLPKDGKQMLTELWTEFEDGETREALLARALDQFQPIMNYITVGVPYVDEPSINREAVIEMKGWIGKYYPELWKIASKYNDLAEERGLYKGK